MSVYMTEDEQLEALKKWWRRYGNWVTLLISLILLSVAGYRYMNWHQEKITEQASMAYENMMASFSNQNIKSVRSYANELISGYSNTVYSDVAHMTLAKVYIDKNKLEKAKNELHAVASKTKVSPLRHLAKIRLARILTAEKDYSNALNELSSIQDKTFLPVINELKGDIYGATGQYQNASNAYLLALTELKQSGMANLFLEIKSNEMASKKQAVAT